MHGSKADMPVAIEAPQGTIREIEWGGMAVELGSFHEEVDPSPFFKGLLMIAVNAPTGATCSKARYATALRTTRKSTTRAMHTMPHRDTRR